jgi:fumarate reductase (CoM/CoB) subunit A
MDKTVIEADVLVIGGGIAGLQAGVEACHRGQKVTILIKGPTCSTGIVGINVAFRNNISGDSPAQFFDDLVLAGKHLNDLSLVALMAYESEAILKDLEIMGVKFQKTDNNFSVRRAAGSSSARTVYFGDTIGPDIMTCFLKYLNAKGANLFKSTTAISLLKHDAKVVGACAVKKNGEMVFINSKATILATGGAGGLYAFSTTPESIDGDGYRMAFEAGAELMDMEFVQFEPFILVAPPELKSFDVPTTSLWDGAKLYNIHGKEFLPKDSEGNVLTLTKDVLSRFIHSEVASGRGTGNGGVYMDWTILPHEVIAKYPRFVKKCQANSLDPYKTPLEVAPACHHMMGGVIIDNSCRTSVEGLFAGGEITSGVHGANRLAGAAGTDVLVFGKRSGISAVNYADGVELLDQKSFNEITDDYSKKLDAQLGDGHINRTYFFNMLENIKNILWKKVGLVRTANKLEDAIKKLSEFNNQVNQAKIDSLEILKTYHIARSACLVSLMIAKAALLREESRGDHFREDYSERDDLKWLKHIVFSSSEKGEFKIEYRDTAPQKKRSWGIK